MRTDEEILARIEAVKEHDWLATQRGDLAARLPFQKAKHLLVDTATEESWTQHPRDPESLKAEMHDYMAFAWGKANNNRGISANRSLEHMSAWLWLMGHDAAADQILTYEY